MVTRITPVVKQYRPSPLLHQNQQRAAKHQPPVSTSKNVGNGVENSKAWRR
jgi:hypothetical protein